MSQRASAKDVAEWMLAELGRREMLYQEVAVYDIARRFGEQFTYHNANGNLAIKKSVLDEFRKLTGDEVVWSRADRFWRKRVPGDLPGRMQY